MRFPGQTGRGETHQIQNSPDQFGGGSSGSGFRLVVRDATHTFIQQNMGAGAYYSKGTARSSDLIGKTEKGPQEISGLHVQIEKPRRAARKVLRHAEGRSYLGARTSETGPVGG